ncbi:squamosa promoter-binding-like protein 12 isoform X2 [Phalaenopsis equestris]|uniref:squamosa promoter-binding-like protein 12 isoform X2 n=1 Tax=Phalaenopsis equestris TaxID=78828 RepID=UPI0009E41B53|nr:squamosa promoter-binding-like protein 12 isoform X2 [Phalaenopsis equestris]
MGIWGKNRRKSSISRSLSAKMDWNLKAPLQWEWENLALFSGKESEITKFTTQAEWRTEDGGVISNGSVYSSGSGTSSGSDLGNGSSRSSVSASVGSSSKVGVFTSELNFEALEGLHQNPNKNNEPVTGEDAETSPAIVRRSGAGEPQLGLKLGKRTYFEDFGRANVKTSITQEDTSVKKARVSHQATQNTYCQVEGCNIDLIGAKDYHRKHRVCENHSKSPKVIIAGQERRFCQQCSRFHDLSEFDQKKRSCRKRLSEHNSRRRKPQPEAISFNSSVLPSSFYANGQQMNFFLSRGPVNDTRPSASTLWEKSSGFSLSTSEGTWPKPTKAGVDGALHLPFLDFSDNFPTSHHGFNRTMPFKGTTAEVLNQGLEASASASNFNGAPPDLRSALSLLSNDSCGPCNAGQSHMIIAKTNPTAATASHPSPVQASNSLLECWQDDRSLTEQALAFNFSSNGSQFQDFHLSKAPFDSPLFEGNQVFSKSDGHFLGFKT